MELFEKIIFECVDSALSHCEFLNKQKFYQLLEISYNVKPESIGANYEVFHTALKNCLGIDHYKVERIILRIMKKRTEDGIYSRTDEISAFSHITNVYLKESEANLKKSMEFTDLKNYTRHLEQVVKDADEKMKSAERMIAIGETAAMVGHDIRNPLQALNNDMYLINETLKDTPDDEKKVAIQESLDSMQENISYINKIVADLQDYSKPLHPEWKDVDINQFVNGLPAIILVPEEIKLELEVNASPKVKTDPLFLRRALTNLMNNAVQAMPDGGKLTVTANVLEDSLCITVSDTGHGIPEDIQKKMFKPLVTTKAKGQGLGLAVVKRLVDALDGHIAFESETGKGTTFRIELPLK